MHIDLQGLLRERIVILDGAMGTMLQDLGMPIGQCPELYGINNQEVLENIHRQYVEAGADIIETNTFGGNRYKLEVFGLGTRTDEINKEAVAIAKRAARGKALVAGSIGPSGKLLRPMGEMEFAGLYAIYSEQALALAEAGADLISIETMMDIGEMKIALIALLQTTSLPVIAHMTFEQGARSMTGTDPLTAMIILEALQPLAIGANCSGGAPELIPVIEIMRRHTQCYLTAEPNAGLPQLLQGKTVYPHGPEEMAEYALRLREAGANIIGGCCGSTPRHIQAMARALKGFRPMPSHKESLRALASRSHIVTVGPDQPLNFIGERINPTARKDLARDIKENHMQIVADEARKQVRAGASVLDVNMGVPGIDEIAAMKKAVFMVQNAADVPISIDTTNIMAMEAGLQNFVGRPLINSATGERKSLETILPLAKKYGAAILGLCLDETGIPKTAAGRLSIARKIYETAKEHGLRDQDIYIDCLVQTASAEQGQVMETLHAIRLIKENLNVGVVLGISNISHGLPARDIINASFLTMAWAAGLDLPIMNPFDERMADSKRAAAVILNRDAFCKNYIAVYGGRAQTVKSHRHNICEACNIPDLLLHEIDKNDKILDTVYTEKQAEQSNNDLWSRIQQAVLEGNKELIRELIPQALRQEDPTEVINRGLIPGIEKAGVLYEKKKYFLPQLMMAGETMKEAFEMVKPLIAGGEQREIGTVILATVKGDIHDIGKNIVAVMLENYGFKVHDLGKDVSANDIIAAAEKEKAHIIGLSALMTTTMPEMSHVIEAARSKSLICKVMVGGAVLNQEYADSIGADGYAPDARQAVLTARQLMGNKHGIK